MLNLLRNDEMVQPNEQSCGIKQDHTEVTTPAYNGYGNEDDLYAMGLSLEPLTKEVNQDEYER